MDQSMKIYLTAFYELLSTRFTILHFGIRMQLLFRTVLREKETEEERRQGCWREVQYKKRRSVTNAYEMVRGFEVVLNELPVQYC